VRRLTTRTYLDLPLPTYPCAGFPRCRRRIIMTILTTYLRTQFGIPTPMTSESTKARPNRRVRLGRNTAFQDRIPLDHQYSTY
jgi:hypothetical protein